MKPRASQFERKLNLAAFMFALYLSIRFIGKLEGAFFWGQNVSL